VERRVYEESKNETRGAGGPAPNTSREAGSIEFVGAGVGIEVAYDEDWGLLSSVKKPITVRIDADVLAWFKKDGRKYQSRINAALRKVMEREMKAR